MLHDTVRQSNAILHNIIYIDSYSFSINFTSSILTNTLQTAKKIKTLITYYFYSIKLIFF